MIPNNVLSHGDVMSPLHLEWRCACGLHGCPVHGALIVETNGADELELWIATVNDTTGAVTRERLADMAVLWLYASNLIRTALWPVSGQVVLPVHLFDYWAKRHYGIHEHIRRCEVVVDGPDRIIAYAVDNDAVHGVLVTRRRVDNSMLLSWDWYAYWDAAARAVPQIGY